MNKLVKVEKKRNEINGIIAILIAYTCFIIFNDWICYIFNHTANIITYGVALIITSIIGLILSKFVKLKWGEFQKYDIIFFGFIISIYFLRVAFPERAFDTLNYHLYMQERPFANNISFNFFPARWINSYTFPLADRMHYFFRFILGYRLGYIFNILIVTVIYYQSKKFLNYFISNKENSPIISILAMIIVTTEQVLTNSINYYVDLISIPFILEIIFIIIKREFNDANHYMTLLMAGIIVALKVSNALILIPLAILYIIYARKTLNIKVIIIGILLAILPISVYALNNYLQTGNPVFPFYNSIFKSPYLPETNWIEEFYGPKSKIERITWPINIVFTPRRAFDTETYYGRISFGYIAAIVLLIDSIINLIKYKRGRKNLEISLMYIILALIWSNFMMGYIRYALFLEILAGIIIIVVLEKYFNNKSVIKNLLAVIISLLLIYQINNTLEDILASNIEYSWRNTVFKEKEQYITNIKECLKKYNYEEYLKDVDCIAISDYNSGYAAILSDKIPIISLLESYNNDFGKEKFEEILEKYKDKNIFTITTTRTKDRALTYLEKTDFEFTGETKQFKTEFLDVEDEIVLLKIRKKEKINVREDEESG